ncbi:MAG: phosphoribosylformylglycinamidine synthase I [Dehalococcoidia bacterium]|nr:MAG: phosphoribosylformylglycinamidine synthase I [Dehalococcoidia bacterium]
MSKVKVLILRAPGTNCDEETAFAFQRSGAETALVHIWQLIRQEKQLKDYQVMVFPGGFTYGDDLGAGRVLANEIRLKLGEDIERFVESGYLILGICNGFQVLVKAGILPGSKIHQEMTLTTNDSSRFECRWVHLTTNTSSKCIFTKDIEFLYLPVAHGEGKVVATVATLEKLDIAIYYTDAKGNRSAGYPYNPNGSMGDIAGICDITGRIFALMPHPERHIVPNQHPRWLEGKAGNQGDGLKIFQNAVDWITKL